MRPWRPGTKSPRTEQRLWRPGTVTLAWLAATTLGAGMAWFGLRPVLDAAVPDRAAPLSAADVRRLATPSTVRPPAPTPPSATPAGSPSPVAPSTPSNRTNSPTVSASQVAVVNGWTVTTQADGSKSYLRSFQVPGGSTVIRMTPGRVFLVSATPNPDYTVVPTQNDPNRLVVQFVATARYDIVDAMWWQGQPYVQINNVG